VVIAKSRLARLERRLRERAESGPRIEVIEIWALPGPDAPEGSQPELIERSYLHPHPKAKAWDGGSGSSGG
jgi:hypothetical protein